MLNYLKAELYKLLHQRSFCISLSLLLVLEGMLVLLQRFTGSSGWSVNRSVALLSSGLAAGFFLIYPLGTLVFSEQYKHNTLKNEISFGIPRARIYLGKLFAAVIVCSVTCVLAVAFFLGFSRLVFPVEPGLHDSLLILGYCLLIALPVWLGALSLLHMLQFTIKSTALYTTLYIAYFLLFAPIVWIFGNSMTDPLWQNAFHALYNVLLPTPLEHLAGNLIPVLGWAWLVGMGWVAGTTALGLFAFSKKDMK